MFNTWRHLAVTENVNPSLQATSRPAKPMVSATQLSCVQSRSVSWWSRRPSTSSYQFSHCHPELSPRRSHWRRSRPLKRDDDEFTKIHAELIKKFRRWQKEKKPEEGRRDLCSTRCRHHRTRRSSHWGHSPHQQKCFTEEAHPRKKQKWNSRVLQITTSHDTFI